MKKLQLKYKYLPPPGNRKPQPLGIKLFPLLPIKLSYNGNMTPYIEGLLDSGSHGLLIPTYIAESLGLPNLGIARSSGVGGSFQGYLSKVTLKIGRGGREIDFGEVNAIVPNEDQNIPILIGREPVFEEFQIIFEDYKNTFWLIPKEKCLKP